MAEVIARVAGAALFAAGLSLVFPALFLRIESPDELWFFRAWDIATGLVFGAAFFLLLKVRRPEGFKSRPMARAAEVLIAWLIVSGALLSWHEAVFRARWYLPPRVLALNDVVLAFAALEDYFRDCGGFPTEEQGLAALCRNPGVEGWSGRYLEERFLIDPWGQPLNYRVEANRVIVWSSGADRRSGTADDVRREEP